MVLLCIMALDSNLSQTADPMLEAFRKHAPAWLTVLALVDRRDSPGVLGGSRVVELQGGTRREPLAEYPELDSKGHASISDFIKRSFASFDGPDSVHLLFYGHGNGVNEATLSPAMRRTLRRGRVELVRLRREREEPWLVPSLDNDTTVPLSTAAFATAVAAGSAGHSLGLMFFISCFNAAVEVFAELDALSVAFVAPEGTLGLDDPAVGDWLPKIAQSDAPSKIGETIIAAFKGIPHDPSNLACFLDAASIVHAWGLVVAGLKSSGVAAKSWIPSAIATLTSVGQKSFYDLQSLCSYLSSHPPGAFDALLAADAAAEIAKARVAVKPIGLGGLSIWLPDTSDINFSPLPNYASLSFSQKTGWCKYLLAGTAWDVGP